MKKLSVVFLSLILTLSLVSCGDKTVAEGGEGIFTGHYSAFDNASQSPDDPSFAVSEGGETTVPDADIIKKDRAIEIALSHAGLSENEVYDLEIEIDYEPNGTFWEIDFKSAGFEYDYEINAVTKEIVKSHKERD